MTSARPCQWRWWQRLSWVRLRGMAKPFPGLVQKLVNSSPLVETSDFLLGIPATRVAHLYKINTDFPGCWWLISVRVCCTCAHTSVNELRLGTVSNIVPHEHSFWIRVSYWCRTSRQGCLSREAQGSVCLCLFQAGITRKSLFTKRFGERDWTPAIMLVRQTRNLLGMCVCVCVEKDCSVVKSIGCLPRGSVFDFHSNDLYTCNTGLRGYETLSRPPRASGMHMVHKYTGSESTHT